MSVKTAYIAAAANRHPQVAAISGTSLAAFGSSNLVALWNIADENDHGVEETLPGHEGLVTCVRFMSDLMFVSADDKGTLLSWRRLGSQWRSTGKLQAHINAISSLCVFDDWIVTGSSDASVKIWRVVFSDDNKDEFVEFQTLPLQGKYPLSLSLTYLPQTKVAILAIAGTGNSVQIWARSDNQFVRAAILAGHEDWIRSLAFLDPPAAGQPLVLASGSQDATIRLWAIEPWIVEISNLASRPTETLGDDLLDAFEASLGELGDAEEGGRQISLKRHIITVKEAQGSFQRFSITFDALLVGHEAGVTSLSWRPMVQSTSVPTLLSTSTDSSVILWSPATISGTGGSASIWTNRQRFGDVGGQRLGGFVGGAWSPQGNETLAWGWAGGWRRWRCSASSTSHRRESWTEVGAVSGHRGPVKCIGWSPDGKYIISTGLDQSTRIHAAVLAEAFSKPVWHEISRPQIHGYDMLGAAFIDPLKFVSIADEKVARVFEAPRGFVRLAEALGVSNFSDDEHLRPVSASVPPLGLSNKATGEGVLQDVVPEVANTRRPFEGELASITLWPETEKIFGHGYESMALTVSTSKRLMATACKASTSEHAVVRIYDTNKYQLVGRPLEGHLLTVTKVAFSPDDSFVLSVSRDRSWRLYEIQGEGGYHPVAADKSHGRIIWDCAWAHEGDIFATASRDKTVKIWNKESKDEWKAVATIKTSAAATAVDFSPGTDECRRRLAIGLETGEILIYSNSHIASSADWTQDSIINSGVAHVSQINQLTWQPTILGIPSTLASSSDDGTLKILIVPTTME